MKKIVLFCYMVVLSCAAFASEISLLGPSPIVKQGAEVGVALGYDLARSSSMSMEVYYRKRDVTSFDLGFTIAPMSIDSIPGSPDLVFDMKTRLFKGGSLIPSFSIGINMVRISDILNNPTFSLFDEGRMGLSWEFENEDGGTSTVVYAGANVIPGSASISNKVFAGAKKGNLNFTLVFDGGLSLVGLSYSFM